MKKIPAIILLFILTASVVIFLFFPDIIFPPKKIVGCMDRTAGSSYDPLATIHDSTMCVSGKTQPTKELQEMEDSLRNSDWDIIRYHNLRTAIKDHFASDGKAGSTLEEVYLDNADYAYMSVIYKETKKVAKKCFSKYSFIKKEVDTFHLIYKNNKDIKKARSLLDKRRKAKSYQKKVKSLLSKKLEKTSYDALEKDISNFMTSGDYNRYIKNCDKLSLRKSYNDLTDFSQVKIEYDRFLSYYEDNKSTWEMKGKVPDPWVNKFKDYKWYSDEIKNIDEDLKNKEAIE